MNDLILRTVTRLIIPFIQVMGIYIVVHGHLSPGGAFAGGAVVAASFILGTMVLGPTSSSGRSWGNIGRVMESVGGIWFIVLGLVGVLVGTGFLSNQAAGIPAGRTGLMLSAGLVPWMGIGLGVKVTATMVSLFRGLAGGQEDD